MEFSGHLQVLQNFQPVLKKTWTEDLVDLRQSLATYHAHLEVMIFKETSV
jgi:hypothetical protein